MKQSRFYGREGELERLERLRRKASASLVVVRGRRRIGKSRLLGEFGKGLRSLFFTGLPPEEGKVSAADQRAFFAKQLELILKIRGLRSDDWSDLFWHLAEATKEGEVLIVLDEINWMGSQDATFLGKLKSAWDLSFKNNPNLLLVLSGSMSAWIEKNILSSTGFFGRISLELELRELPLSICNLFWRKQKEHVSSYEKFKILSVTGGVPRYLEEIDPRASAEVNIQNLAFSKGGVLVEEYERIFSDLFSKRSPRYQKIVQRLAEGHASFDQICEALEMEKGGTVSQYLDDLIETGYVACDRAWKFRGGVAKTMRYRLSDNYLRFYLKVIQPRLGLIEKGRVETPPNWFGLMGLQFENLVVNRADPLLRRLGIRFEDVVNEGPFIQRATKARRGCQIDYLVQDRFNTLYLFEIKFSTGPVEMRVIDEVQNKLDALERPKNFSYRPILVHVNGVSPKVQEEGFFSEILDFSTLLERD